MHPAGAEAELVYITHIFGVTSLAQVTYCFVSGFCLERDKPYEKNGVRCYKLPAEQEAVMPLLPGTRLEGVSIMPFYFIAGKSVGRLTTHVLAAPRETLPSFRQDLCQHLRQINEGLLVRAAEAVRIQAGETARQERERPRNAEREAKKMKHGELGAELTRRGVTCRHDPAPGAASGVLGKLFQQPVLKSLLLASLRKDGADALSLGTSTDIQNLVNEAKEGSRA